MTTIEPERLRDVVGGKSVEETCKGLRDGNLFYEVGEMVGKNMAVDSKARVTPATLESAFTAAQGRADAWQQRCNARGARAAGAGFSSDDMESLLRNTR